MHVQALNVYVKFKLFHAEHIHIGTNV